MDSCQRVECQTACKPGSVRDQVALMRVTTIPLGRTLRCASRDQPGRRSGNAPVPRGTTAPIRSCSRWGLPCRPCCQGCGALLPHRFALARGTPCGTCAGGLFSVALSLGSPPPAVSRHRFPVEPGLSSACGSGRPAVWRRREVRGIGAWVKRRCWQASGISALSHCSYGGIGGVGLRKNLQPLMHINGPALLVAWARRFCLSDTAGGRSRSSLSQSARSDAKIRKGTVNDASREA